MVDNYFSRLQIPDEHRSVATNHEQGSYLYELARLTAAAKTLEVGLGFGSSAVYIMAATRLPHVVVDPWARSYRYAGLQNIAAEGFAGLVDHRERASQIELAELVRQQCTFDLIYVDGGHKFDETLVDVYFCAQLLAVGGHMVIDDLWMPGVRRVRDFILANREDLTQMPCPVEDFLHLRRTGYDTREWNHFVPF
ncbi:O-methyltransferase [Kineococcus aurantiacus]|uniref:Putative O-methyltransferase YrrM n=1 Tax=Kineococcus aurantiacus TaxID=37633 RepID=A0A7Y9DQT5_9ACTN|nr:class I SAM-dependent methyltransferase [Kineococcus aurantiacus]NYD25121.1 putative O-methyltransferase YrrM [Kineococcus aurantiacus]